MSAAAVLYVEDDKLIRELVAEALEDAGIKVMVAADAPTALAVLEHKIEPPVRVVITDIDLGAGPDGWEVARRARIK